MISISLLLKRLLLSKAERRELVEVVVLEIFHPPIPYPLNVALECDEPDLTSIPGHSHLYHNGLFSCVTCPLKQEL